MFVIYSTNGLVFTQNFTKESNLISGIEQINVDNIHNLIMGDRGEANFEISIMEEEPGGNGQ